MRDKKQTEFYKNCPICCKILYYSNKGKLSRSLKNNTSCQSCFAKKRAKDPNYIKKLSEGVKKSWEFDSERKKDQSEKFKKFWKNLSEEEKKSIRKNMSNNFNRSEERIEKARAISKKLWQNEDFVKKQKESYKNPETSEKRRQNILKQLMDPNSKINSKEVKQKRIASSKKTWEQKPQEEKEKILLSLAKTIHSFHGKSKLEKFVFSKIEHMGFKTGQVVAGYCVDIVHEKYPLVIEVYGDYWHANPKVYEDDWYHPVIKKTAKEIKLKDESRIENIKKSGYDTLILWQKDIKNKKYNFVEIIKKELEKYLS